MDTLSSGYSADVSSTWRLIKIDNTEYVISFKIVRDKWKILLSNLIELWRETVTEDSAIRRCEKLNPLLNVNVFNVKKILQEILDDIPKHVVCASLSSIRLEATISGGALKFDLNLTKASPEEFWQEVTKPLCESSMEMQRRQSMLLNLIKRKDEEIAEYKAGGGELIRKNIETATFHENLFKKTSSCSSSAGSIMDTFSAMMDLYSQIKEPESLMKIKSEPLSSGSRDGTTEAKVTDEKDEINQSSMQDFSGSSQQGQFMDLGDYMVKSSGRLKNEGMADDDSKQEVLVATGIPAKRLRRKDKTNELLS